MSEWKLRRTLQFERWRVDVSVSLPGSGEFSRYSAHHYSPTETTATMSERKEKDVDRSPVIDLTQGQADFLQTMGYLFPVRGWLLRQAFGHLFDRGEVKEVDAENIAQIIEAGEKSDVENMQIRVDKDQVIGGDLKGSLKGKKYGANIGISGETVYEIDVEYKD